MRTLQSGWKMMDCTQLTKCPLEKLPKLIHGVIDKLCDRAPTSYHEFSEVFALDEWWEITDICTAFCKHCGKEGLSCGQIAKGITGHVSEEYKQVISEAVSVRNDDLRRSLLESTCALSHAQLKDFDWQLKLVMSSDKIAGLMEPLVSVDLDVQTDKERRITSVELTKADLQNVISSLEAANRAALQLKI